VRLATLALAAALPLLVAATPVELAIHVAVDDAGAPVADAAWLDEQVGLAAQHLAGADVELTWRDAGDALATGDVDSVAERDALAAHAGDRAVVHVFVVPRLADKDVEGAWLSGVHWRYGGGARRQQGRRYVILSREARSAHVLAHELGHFFGLAHTDTADGLMTSGGQRGGEPSLDAGQLRTVKRKARAWAKRARRSR
jgi:predicted RecA/RadA family phage recombinase